MTRAAFFRWHSWLGITTGVFMLVVAWSGSLAVFNDELEWVVNRELRADPAAQELPVDLVIERLRAAYPGRDFDLHLRLGPSWAHTGFVYGGGLTRFIHVDPATGRVTRDDAMDGYYWNLRYFIRQLHVRLLMGLWGRVFVGLLGVTLVLSIVTSLWIYRDWLRSLVRVRRGDGRRVFHMDLHKAVGAWALIVNLIFGVTGAVLGVENLYYQVFPRKTVPPSVNTRVSPALEPGLTPGTLAARLASADPSFVPRVIEIAEGEPVTVRGDHPGALIAKNASFYSVDLTTGTIVAASDARRVPWPTYLYNTLDPLHFGYFGEKWGLAWGYAIEGLWCVLGLTPGVLSITGGYMWLLRRRRARAAAAARRALQPGLDVPPARPVATAWTVACALAFLLAGYAVQATVWGRGWGMSEMLWQHWIVKPACLLLVAFPIVLAALLLGRRLGARLDAWHGPAASVAVVLPVGVLYLVATSLLN